MVHHLLSLLKLQSQSRYFLPFSLQKCNVPELFDTETASILVVEIQPSTYGPYYIVVQVGQLRYEKRDQP